MRRPLVKSLGLGAGFGLWLATALGPDFALAQAPGPAQAYPQCTQAPDQAQIAAAKAGHKAAMQAYARGDYNEAIRQWTGAYQADCTAHGLLVNIGNAYQKKGDKQAAMAAFLAYVQRAGWTPAIAAQIQGLKQAAPGGSAGQASPPPRSSSACDGAPSAENLDRSRALQKAAAEAYYVADYDRAIKFLRTAYDADCTAHALLVTIARAEEKRGDRAAAVASYQAYLAKAGPDRAIEEKIAALKRAQPEARR